MPGSRLGPPDIIQAVLNCQCVNRIQDVPVSDVGITKSIKRGADNSLAGCIRVALQDEGLESVVSEARFCTLNQRRIDLVSFLTHGTLPFPS